MPVFPGLEAGDGVLEALVGDSGEYHLVGDYPAAAFGDNWVGGSGPWLFGGIALAGSVVSFGFALDAGFCDVEEVLFGFVGSGVGFAPVDHASDGG